jgi:hypothetical protein
MMNRLTLASVGALMLYDNLHHKIRNARDDGHDALRLSENNRDLLELLIDSPDRARIGQPAVRDVLLGIGYPVQLPQGEHTTFPTPPVVVSRPAFVESQALSPDWPPATNAYDGSGKLVNPSQAQNGQFFNTGVAMGYAEFKAMLLGGTLPDQPSAGEQEALFRHARGLVQVIRELRAAGDIPLTEVKEDWRRFYNNRYGAFHRDGEGGDAFSATAEAEIISVPWPGDLLRVGEWAEYEIGLGECSPAGTDTLVLRWRIDTLAGTGLMAATLTPTSNDAGTVRLRVMRGPDVGGVPTFSFNPSVDMDNKSTQTNTNSTLSFAAQDRTLILTGVWGGATNSIRALNATGARY